MISPLIPRLMGALIAGTGLAPAVVLTGSWVLEPAGRGTHRLTLRLRAAQSGTPVALAVATAAFDVPAPGNAFAAELRRDAGLLRLRGVATGPGSAAGSFEFEDNAAFLNRAGKLVRNRWDPALGFELFIRDVQLCRVDKLLGRGLADLSLAQLARAGPEDPGPPGVAGRFVPAPPAPVPVGDPDEFGAAGYVFFAEDVQALRPFGLSGDWLRQLKRSGYDALSVQDLIRLRSQGVSAHDLLRLELEGRRNLTVDEIIRARYGEPAASVPLRAKP